MPDQALVSAEAEVDHSSLVSRRETAVGSGLRTREEGGGCVRWWDVGEDVIADALEMSDGLCPLPAHRGFAYVAPLLKLPFSCDCLGADIRVGPLRQRRARALVVSPAARRRLPGRSGPGACSTVGRSCRMGCARSGRCCWLSGSIFIYSAPVRAAGRPWSPDVDRHSGGFVRAAGRTARLPSAATTRCRCRSASRSYRTTAASSEGRRSSRSRR